MLQSLVALRGFRAHVDSGSPDPLGPLGVVRDFVLDTRNWQVSHLVVAARELAPEVAVPFRTIRHIDISGRALYAVPRSRRAPSQTRSLLVRARELRRLDLRGTSGVSGHVEDLVVENATWCVRYVVIESAAADETTWIVLPPTELRVNWLERRGHFDRAPLVMTSRRDHA